MDLCVEHLSKMTPEQARPLWEPFETAVDSDTGEAAKAHLAAGRPIYYGDPAYPGAVVKQYPDSRRQAVCFELQYGMETIIKDL